MMDICHCYHVEYGKPVCWGTKEREECSCGGDESKCNFYPNKHVKAEKASTDILSALKRLTDKGYILTISPTCLAPNALKLKLIDNIKGLRLCKAISLKFAEASVLDPTDILVREINNMIDEMDNAMIVRSDDFRVYSGLLD